MYIQVAITVNRPSTVISEELATDVEAGPVGGAQAASGHCALPPGYVMQPRAGGAGHTQAGTYRDGDRYVKSTPPSAQGCPCHPVPRMHSPASITQGLRLDNYNRLLAEYVARNSVELVRLMHHSMNHSEPPANYRCSASTEGDDEVYLAPGGQTLVALFTVTNAAQREQNEVHNTEDALTWQYITALRSLQDVKHLQVMQKPARPTGEGAVSPDSQATGAPPSKRPAGAQFYLPDMLLQLFAGAPTLAIVLADRREIAVAEVRTAAPLHSTHLESAICVVMAHVSNGPVIPPSLHLFMWFYPCAEHPKTGSVWRSLPSAGGCCLHLCGPVGG